jgi:threonine synthase
MNHIKTLKCLLCGREHGVHETLYTCLDCGPTGVLDVVYDMDVVAQRWLRHRVQQSETNLPASIWRYQDLLPVQEERYRPPLQIGWTPLYHSTALARCYTEQHGMSLPENLYLKDDGRNPTASYKDRASVMAVMKAQELGKDVITCASTGNAASSLAGLAASLGITTYIFLPESASQAKVAQLLMFGANVMMVRGTYDQAFDLCLQATEQWGWYSRNSGFNPYLGEGKKTGALEICEQLDWHVPDKVFVPVGDGCIIGGIWKGFCDLYALECIDRLPQLIGVQAAGANPLEIAFETGNTIQPQPHIHTIADGIAVGQPRDGLKALRAVRESHGRMISVTDDEILDAMRGLARYAGVFAESAGATAFAGLIKLTQQGLIDKDERVVVLVTGNGLKDIDTAIRVAGDPFVIDPEFEAAKRVIHKTL